MIIKSIEISNFLSYHDKTVFKFDEGATIIIGQNNTGKSKLFDAYNWVLYDEAYKTAAEDWVSTKEWKDELVNKLAKKNCEKLSWIEVYVSLTFIDDELNTYVVTRDYRVQRTEKNEWNSSNTSEITLTKTARNSLDHTNMRGNDAREELYRFFPKNLSRYFLFQGEGISRLLRLNQRSDFTRAIGELSGIKYFDKAKRYAEKVYQKAKFEFETKEETNITVQQNKISLAKEITDLKDKYTYLEKTIENEYKERDNKQRNLGEKVDELSHYEECANLLLEIKNLEIHRDSKLEQVKNIFQYNRNNLMSFWIYGKLEDNFSNFLQLYRKGKNENMIPEPIRQDFIHEMLQDHICKVCGTDAPDNSIQYKNIFAHLNDKSLDKEIALINTLSDTADTMKINIDNISDDINEFNSEYKNIQNEINKLQNTINYKEDELRAIIERIEAEEQTKINRIDIERVNLVQLKKTIDQIRNELNLSQGKIDQLLGKKEFIENNLIDKDREFEKLISKSSNQLEKDRMILAGDILKHVSNLYNSFLINLINDIEYEANEYFHDMTNSNPALSGKVRVDYENKEVYTINENGQRMTNINQANKVSLQIVFVAAILTVSNKIWEKDFPFVADAPISALGGNNKLSAVRTMTNIFKQSIIILKDDADITNVESVRNDQIRQLIQKNSKINHAYELRMEGSSIDEQRTIVSILK